MIELPKLRQQNQNFASRILNPSGFSSVLLLILLIAGIGLGTYLVQNRTNINPFASDSPDPTVLSTSPNAGCDIGGDIQTCSIEIKWDSESSESVKLIVFRGTFDATNTFLNVERAAKGTEKIGLPVGRFTILLKKLDGTEIASVNTTIRRDPDGINTTQQIGVSCNDFDVKSLPNLPTGFEYKKYCHENCDPDDLANPNNCLNEVYAGKEVITRWCGGFKEGPRCVKVQKSTNTSSTKGTSQDKVPVVEGDFPSKEAGDFIPRSDKQKILDKFLNGEIPGMIECRNTNAKGDPGSSLWAVPDKATDDISKDGVYIIDCSKDAIGSYKNSVSCGKRPNGNSYKYGCIDKSLKSSSPAKASEEPTTTEKQLADCGFTTTESGVPLFSVQVGGKSSEVDTKKCDELIEAQIKYFNSKIAKAQAEADEAKKRGDTEKAAELQSKVNSATKKVEDCKEKSGASFTECAKEAQKTVSETATAAHSQAIKNALVKLEEIMAKKRPGGCVKADLGIAPFLEAQRLKRKPSRGTGGQENDEARRLLLCQGTNKDDLKWRVLVSGSSGSEFADDGDDKGDDAERIYGLHGTTPDATGAPNYPYTVPGKNGFIIYDPNTADGVEKTIGKYIEAAKAGKTTMRSAPVEGDNIAGGSPSPSPNK